MTEIVRLSDFRRKARFDRFGFSEREKAGEIGEGAPNWVQVQAQSGRRGSSRYQSALAWVINRDKQIVGSSRRLATSQHIRTS